MSTSPSVIVWGELLWDRFPDGDQLGGAPANVAWHLAQLGVPVALVTRVGADRDGEEARARLAAAGVDTSLIQIDPERATGEVAVTVELGEPRYKLVPDRAWEAIEMNPAIEARLQRARALVYGTLSQRRFAGLGALRAAREAAGRGVLHVCDPNLRPSSPSPGDAAALIGALHRPEIVKLNERELALITARLGIADPVTWLLQEGARLVAVTRGAAGSTWFAPGGRTFDIPAVPARPGGDNVGCGDAYVAGLTYGLLAGLPWARIGAIASAIAAEVASARGATPIVDGAALLGDLP